MNFRKYEDVQKGSDAGTSSLAAGIGEPDILIEDGVSILS
jgi:hypothetical protein